MGKLADLYYEVGYKIKDGGLKKAENGLKKIGEATEGVNASKVIAGVGKAGAVAGAVLVSASVVAAVAINKATNEYALFEDQLKKVNAKGDMTAESFKVLKDAAFEAGKNTRFSATEAAKGLEYMAMAGWSAVDSAKALPAALNMAIVSGEELSLVTDIMTDQMTVFKLSSDEAEHFSDVLAYSANKSNTSIGMMGEAMKYAGPPMAALGSTAEETAALFMSMADGGIKASQAGTALRMGALRLVKPTKEAERALKRLNIEMTDIETGEFKGMTSFVEQFTEATNGMTKAKKMSYLATIVGTEAVSAFSTVIEQGTDKIKRNTNALKSNKGYAKDVTKYMANTLQGQLTSIESKSESVRLKIGETFAPAKLEALKVYSGTLDGILSSLGNDEKMQEISDFATGVVLQLADGFSAIGGAIGSVVENSTKFLNLVTGGIFKKMWNKYYTDTVAQGKDAREEQELAEIKLKEVKEGKESGEGIGVKIVLGSPVKEKEKTLSELAGFKTTTSVFSPSYDLSGMNINFPQGTNVENPEQIQKIIQKTVLKTLEDRDKILLNQMNPRRR